MCVCVLGWVSPLSLFENSKRWPDFVKRVPWFWSKFPGLCITHVLNSHLKYSSKSWWKNINVFPWGAFLLYVAHETFTEVSLTQETSSALKNFWFPGWETYVGNWTIFCTYFINLILEKVSANCLWKWYFQTWKAIKNWRLFFSKTDPKVFQKLSL